MGYVNCNLGSFVIRWVRGHASVGVVIRCPENRMWRLSPVGQSAQEDCMRLGEVGALGRPLDAASGRAIGNGLRAALCF